LSVSAKEATVAWGDRPIEPEVLAALERDAGAVAGRMTRAILAEIPEYAGVPPPVAAQVEAHCVDHVHAFVAWGRAGRRRDALDLRFVRARAEARVPSPIPLSALVRSYLIGEREFWLSLVAASPSAREDPETLTGLTAAAFEYTHHITAALAQAYHARELALAVEDDRSRRDLLEALLAGGDGAAAQADRLQSLGLGASPGQVVVVVAPDGEALPEDCEATLAHALGLARGTGLVCLRRNELVAVVPASDDLRARLGPAVAALGTARAGIGLSGRGARDVARGYAEARRALAQTSAAEPVRGLGDLGVVEYVAASADETAARLIQPDARALIERDSENGGRLAQTLEALAAADMNVSRAAKALYVHPNTVRYRMRRIREESGLDPNRFDELAELLTAARILGRSGAAQA
jgi:hypothetical protein